MLDSHKYYKAYQTAVLVDLLVEVTQKYTSASPGESKLTLNSYYELIDFLQKEIQGRYSNTKNIAGPVKRPFQRPLLFQTGLYIYSAPFILV